MIYIAIPCIVFWQIPHPLVSVTKDGCIGLLKNINNYISNQVTQIRNTPTVTERKDLICETSLIENISHQKKGEYDLYIHTYIHSMDQ